MLDKFKYIVRPSDFKKVILIFIGMLVTGLLEVLSVSSILPFMAVVTNPELIQENNKEGVFDKILVDAPCSGTGTIRKSFKTLRIWNPNVVRRIAGQQKQLIDTGFKLLKKGGTLVYSTCTLEPEEDEGIISWLLDKYDGESEESKCMKAKVEKIELKGLVRSKPIMEFEGTKYNSKVKDCLRIWPQDNNTEGFFVCKIQKI